MHWFIIIPLIVVTVGTVASHHDKFRVAQMALHDVPPEEREPVVRALASCFSRWRR